MLRNWKALTDQHATNPSPQVGVYIEKTTGRFVTNTDWEYTLMTIDVNTTDFFFGVALPKVKAGSLALVDARWNFYISVWFVLQLTFFGGKCMTYFTTANCIIITI